jgi:hypothetical protein
LASALGLVEGLNGDAAARSTGKKGCLENRGERFQRRAERFIMTILMRFYDGGGGM